MCLLVALFHTREDAPLVVAANRDEQIARPAESMAVLRESGPRVLGGRDLLAGGTWLAVSEYGVIAALTNVPSASGRDPAKRSRGELPLWLAGHRNAREAAAAFERAIDPTEYNPCWLLVGDRESLFYFDLNGGPLVAQALPPGIHVLENRPLRPVSIKARFVRGLVEDALPPPVEPRESLIAPLFGVLRRHDIPDAAQMAEARTLEPWRPDATFAPCVHGNGYGTRTGAVVIIPSSPAVRPDFHYTDGPPCTAPLEDATPRWAR